MTSIASRVLVAGMLAIGVASPATALVYQVSGASLSCSDAGGGTPLQPFCTIGRAAAVAIAGDTVNVAAAAYREQVVLPTSGAAGTPITFHGAAGARVLGTNNLSGAGLWTLEPGSLTRYSASFDPDSAAAQVFVNGARLTGPVATLADVTTGTFFFDNPGNRLYVDIGGPNPGTRTIEAGARSFGFLVDGKTDLVIEGFEVSGHNTNAIRVQTASRVVVRNNRLLWSAGFVLAVQGTTVPTTTDHVAVTGNEVAEGLTSGIRLRNNVTLSLVQDNVVHHNEDHGLLASATTNSRFSGNTFYANAKPGGQFTTGMRLDGSDDNIIDRNASYENQDSGFQVTAGSDRNLLVRNLSYANGDHGFDIRENDGTRVVSNTSAGNLNDGFSIEGSVTNTTLRNNVAAENGIFSGGNELWVDATSTTGFSSDYDVFYHSTGVNTVEYGGTVYGTVAAFRTATGHESHGSGANPNFTNVAADDYHPGAGPAIDAADAGASGFESLDLDGLPPLDQPAVANTGAGVPNFADRGALEAMDAAPIARLTVTPKQPLIGQLVTANASASADDLGIVRYRFQWGDGVVTTQGGPVATHRYATRGPKKVVLTVTDTAGQTGSVQVSVNVRP
jgi:parallel beta-helix repeat protein